MQIEKIGDRSLVNIFGQRDYHTNTESFKKTLFVTQLGELLHDMGIGIDGAKLKDNDTLTVIYKSGREKDVNIAMDSNSAIVYDVFRQCKIFDF